MKSRKEINKIRRKNAKLYPIYKMFSWDLLFFYSIEFLFYTMTKKITPSEVLFISGLYLIFKILCQIPAVFVTDILGKKNSIVLGNFILIIYLLTLMLVPGPIGVIIAYWFCALGYDIKIIAEANLLYDSVATRGGDGLYSKLDSKGGCGYYIIAGIGALVSGYLFVINNYLPIIICLGFIIISTIISLKFEDIHEVDLPNKEKISKSYLSDLSTSFKFILKSKRMKSFILFQVVFYSLIRIMITYQGDLLQDVGVPEQEFSMIFAVSTLIGGLSISMKRGIEKKFKNRTLAFLSLIFILATITIGALTSVYKGREMISLIVLMYVVQQFCASIWYILESKYLRSFTTETSRNKVAFVYQLIGSVMASLASILGGLLLKIVSIENAFLIVGLVSLILIILVLDYMRTRFGLKPDEYSKEDIDFDI